MNFYCGNNQNKPSKAQAWKNFESMLSNSEPITFEQDSTYENPDRLLASFVD